MDYKRIYHLCLLDVGVLLLLSYVPELLAVGLSIIVLGILIGGVIMVAGALYGLARPEEVNGPTESSFAF